jgi:glycosyltransferase involved in cell wall biosynthesis
MIEASLIVPLRDEERYVERCLNSLLENNYPAEKYEIILVDGMSEDKTPEILAEFAAKKSGIRILQNPRQITSFGLNIGLRHAKGTYVFFILAHVVYAPDYLSTAIALLNSGIADGVGAPFRTATDTPLRSAIFAATDCYFGNGGSRHYRLNYEGFANTIFSGAYKRECIERVGGYDEECIRVQDMELNYRIIEGGGRLYITPKLNLCYYPRATLISLLKRYFVNGFWKIKVYTKHLTTAYWIHVLPAFFVLFFLLLFVLSFVNPYYINWFIGFSVLYLTSNVYFSILGALKSRLSSLILLSVIFPIMHLSFGLGLFAGFIKFSLFERIFHRKK